MELLGCLTKWVRKSRKSRKDAFGLGFEEDPGFGFPKPSNLKKLSYDLLTFFSCENRFFLFFLFFIFFIFWDRIEIYESGYV